MSATTTAPPLNASGTDALIAPPPAPPLDASNHPDDQARGATGEMSPAEQAASDAARRAPAENAEVNPRAEAAAEAAEENAPATEKPPAKADDTPPWMKAEITKERNKAREAVAAAEALRAELTAAAKARDDAVELAKSFAPKPDPTPVAEPRPVRDDFVSPDAYDAAIDAWGARNAQIAADKAAAAARADVAREQREQATRDQQQAQEREAATLATTWNARREAALAELPDYAEVAEADTVQISPPMAEAIMRSDIGPKIAYHLGKNPEEAARISALPPGTQLFEMGRLAATLALPAAPRVSRAPAPITPIQGTREEATNVGREESMEEVAARHAKSARRNTMWGRAAG